ncbi:MULTISPECIES: hypothetical protein [Bradyrhizobium]|uniref:hypothetical protein n=1 Tax=Bradyrhizobium TaxID=374 RepID=UPI0003F923F7|nr:MULTISPECIES: hypothetical protein [Bradyrhizobium]UFW46312.1 hypothetical protein BaraCB756_28865 [Bradyrhizobium arachidis]
MDPSKDLQELISRLAVALGIGLLIGLERGRRRRQASRGCIARLSPDTLSTSDAAVAILGAVASNTISKIVIWSEQLRCG